MENYEELMELTSDIRYGDVMIIYNKTNPNDKLIKKTLSFSSLSALKSKLSLLEARKSKNHTNLINFIKLSPDPENLKITTYHEFIDEFFDLKKTDIQELIIMFKDILKALRVLNSLKKFHGDLRKDFIAFDKISKNYFLIDRFRNEVDFYACQVRNIDDYKDLYMSDRLFDAILRAERDFGYCIDDEIFSLGFICLGFFCDAEKLQDLYDFEKRRFDREKFFEIFEEVYAKKENEKVLEKSFLTFLKNYVFGKDRLQIDVAFSALKKVEEFKNLFAYDHEMEINEEDEKNLKNVKTYEILNLQESKTHKKISNQKVNLEDQKNNELDKLEKYLGTIENKNLKTKLENTENINFEKTQNNINSKIPTNLKTSDLKPNQQNLIYSFKEDSEDELEHIKYLKIKLQNPIPSEPKEIEEKDFYNNLSKSIELKNNKENDIEFKNKEINKNNTKKNLSTFLRDTVKLERESKRQKYLEMRKEPVIIVNQKKTIEPPKKLTSENFSVLKNEKKEMKMNHYNILNIKKKKSKSKVKKILESRKTKNKKKKNKEKERISQRITSLQNLEKKLKNYHIKNKERITNRSKSRTTNKVNKVLSHNEYGLVSNKSNTIHNFKNQPENVFQNQKVNQFNNIVNINNKKNLNSQYYNKKPNGYNNGHIRGSFDNLSKNLLSNVSYINYPEKMKNTNHYVQNKNTRNTHQKVRSSNFIDCYTPNFIQNHIQKKVSVNNNLQPHQIYNQKNIIERESMQQSYKNGYNNRTSHNSHNSSHLQVLNKNIHLYKTPQKMYSTNNSNRSNFNDYQNKQYHKGSLSVKSGDGGKGSTLWINSPFENNRKSQKDHNIYQNQHKYYQSNDYGYGA